jgi:hypothetical protein
MPPAMQAHCAGASHAGPPSIPAAATSNHQRPPARGDRHIAMPWIPLGAIDDARIYEVARYPIRSLPSRAITHLGDASGTIRHGAQLSRLNPPRRLSPGRRRSKAIDAKSATLVQWAGWGEDEMICEDSEASDILLELVSRAIKAGADDMEIEYKNGREEVFAVSSGIGVAIASWIPAAKRRACCARSCTPSPRRSGSSASPAAHTPCGCRFLTASARMRFASRLENNKYAIARLDPVPHR